MVQSGKKCYNENYTGWTWQIIFNALPSCSNWYGTMPSACWYTACSEQFCKGQIVLVENNVQNCTALLEVIITTFCKNVL
jgi:hypothetical protein